MADICVYELIINSIAKAIEPGKKEPDIVKDSIAYMKKETQNIPSHITIKAESCHQKPYAFFVNPPCMGGKVKTELGDYLFVCKHKQNGIITDQRALFFQVKKCRKDAVPKIEQHQLQFYLSIDSIEFRFGNTVYAEGGIDPIVWHNISTTRNFGDYIIIRDQCVHDISTNRIKTIYSCVINGDVAECYELICGDSPLKEFLSSPNKGTKISGSFKSFINLIYKKLGMEADPPDENEGFWLEAEGDKNNSFGLVEITVDGPEDIFSE
jgi:hypothetical protein